MKQSHPDYKRQFRVDRFYMVFIPIIHMIGFINELISDETTNTSIKNRFRSEKRIRNGLLERKFPYGIARLIRWKDFYLINETVCPNV